MKRPSLIIFLFLILFVQSAFSKPALPTLELKSKVKVENKNIEDLPYSQGILDDTLETENDENTDIDSEFADDGDEPKKINFKSLPYIPFKMDSLPELKDPKISN